MGLFVFFLSTFISASTLCFGIEMINPNIRHNKLSRQQILKNYNEMLPTVLVNLAITKLYFIQFGNALTFSSTSLPPNEWYKWYMYLLAYFIGWILLTDIFFYTSHRIFHNNDLYWLHARHHKYRYSHGMGAIYASIPDHFICNILSMSLPIYLLQIPYDIMKYIVIVATFNTVFISHSSFIYFTLHLNHHLKYKVNYGLVFMDVLLGTSYAYSKNSLKMEEKKLKIL